MGDPADARADQFSLAVIGFQALAGVRPFHADSPIALMSQIAFGEAALQPGPGDRMSTPTAAVFERALSKSPAARYSSCSELASAFQAALVHVPAAPTRLATQVPAPDSTIASVEKLVASRERSLVPWIVGTSLIVALAAAAAFFLLRTSPTSAPVVDTSSPVPATLPSARPSPPADATTKPVVDKSKVKKAVRPAKASAPQPAAGKEASKEPAVEQTPEETSPPEPKERLKLKMEHPKVVHE